MSFFGTPNLDTICPGGSRAACAASVFKHVGTALLLVGSALGAAIAATNVPAPLTATPGSPLTASSALLGDVKKPAVTVAKAITKPEWHELNASQQSALAPLATNWNTISEGHKRKWLEISRNFAALPSSEKMLIHGRMTEWAGLSPQQRSQARLNFAGARELPADERLTKWQAYQALSADEKQKLAAGTPSKPVGAAPAVKPVSPQKLTMSPVPYPAASDGTRIGARPSPKIATGAHEVDHHTLLPQQVSVDPVAPASTNE